MEFGWDLAIWKRISCLKESFLLCQKFVLSVQINLNMIWVGENKLITISAKFVIFRRWTYLSKTSPGSKGFVIYLVAYRLYFWFTVLVKIFEWSALQRDVICQRVQSTKIYYKSKKLSLWSFAEDFCIQFTQNWGQQFIDDVWNTLQVVNLLQK